MNISQHQQSTQGEDPKGVQWHGHIPFNQWGCKGTARDIFYTPKLCKNVPSPFPHMLNGTFPPPESNLFWAKVSVTLGKSGILSEIQNHIFSNMRGPLIIRFYRQNFYKFITFFQAYNRNLEDLHSISPPPMITALKINPGAQIVHLPFTHFTCFCNAYFQHNIESSGLSKKHDTLEHNIILIIL